jgi:hypothetical protein
MNTLALGRSAGGNRMTAHARFEPLHDAKDCSAVVLGIHGSLVKEHPPVALFPHPDGCPMRPAGADLSTAIRRQGCIRTKHRDAKVRELDFSGAPELVAVEHVCPREHSARRSMFTKSFCQKIYQLVP